MDPRVAGRGVRRGERGLNAGPTAMDAEPDTNPAIADRTTSGASAVRSVTAAGRWADPRAFLADWIDDVRGCPRLAWRMFLRGINQRYRHSILGTALAFAPVALTALVLAFGRRAQLISEDVGGVNAAFFGAFGILLAQAFSEAVSDAQRLFTGNSAFLRRQNVPIESPLVACLLELAMRDVVRIAVIAILMACFSVSPSPWMPLAAWALFGISLAGAALGLASAPFASLTADLQVLARALLILVIATTPVFVVGSPESPLGRIQAAIPLSWAFDAVRAAAYGAPGSLAVAAGTPIVAAGLFLGAWFLCRLARPHVLERMTGQGG